MSGNNIEELTRKFQAGEHLEVWEKARLARNQHELPEPVQQQLVQQLEAEVFQAPDSVPMSKWQRKRRRRQERKQQQAE